MGWLKKIGTVVAEGLQIVLGFAPVLEALRPQDAGVIATAVSDLQAFAGIITSVEAGAAALAVSGTPLTGPQKLTMALPAFEQAVLQSQFFVGKKIQNEAAFKAAISGIASNYVDLLNSLHDTVETTGKT